MERGMKFAVLLRIFAFDSGGIDLRLQHLKVGVRVSPESLV
jgi:hypothetical protein